MTNTGELEQDFLLQGDEAAWSLNDWNWDSQNFIATPKKGVVAASNPCRAAKRSRMELSTCQGPCVPGAATDQQTCTDDGVFPTMSRAVPCSTIIQPAEPLPGSDGCKQGGPSCQVEGCNRELSDLSAYHQKCRICDIHIKAPSFMRAGLKQRFCQRCGRCHELDAFEGSKRSCIAQLVKHNARRRRQQNTTAALEDVSALSLDLLATQSNSFSDQSLPMSLPMSQPPQAGFSYQALMGPEVALGVPIGVHSSIQGHTSAAMPLLMNSIQTPANAGLGSSMEQALMQMGHPSGQVQQPIVSTSQALPDDQPGSRQQQPTTAASAVAAGLPAAAVYQASSLVVRLSVKLFNCTPGDLPQGLREQLCNWLCATPAGAEGYIRPGCLHLTMQMHVDAGAHVAEGIVPVVESLLEQPAPVWYTHRMLVQRDAEVALVQNGQLQSVAVASGPASQHMCQPQIHQVLPSAVVCQDGAHEDITVQVSVQGLDSSDTIILARCNGRYLDVQVERMECESEIKQLVLRLKGATAPGLVWLEAQRGVVLSPAAPLLLLPPGHHALTAEVQRIVSSSGKQQPSGDQRKCCEGFLADLGLVLSHAAPLQPMGLAPLQQLMRGPSDTPVTATLVTKTARHLLAFACDAGAPALAHFLLPSASVGCGSAAEVVAAVDGAEARGGATLLHRAVRSGSAPLLKGLLAWGAAHDYQWKADVPDATGLTPLHFAAIAPNADTVVHLLRACSCSPQVWFTAAADDGLTPAHFAARFGRTALNEQMLLLAQESNGEVQPKVAGCGCTCGDACACSRSGICRCAAASGGPGCDGSGGRSGGAGTVKSAGQSSVGGCGGSTGSCCGNVVCAETMPAPSACVDAGLPSSGNSPMSACCVGASL
ncbi:g7212 [Coccomyxa elongata]